MSNGYCWVVSVGSTCDTVLFSSRRKAIAYAEKLTDDGDSVSYYEVDTAPQEHVGVYQKEIR